MDFIEALRDRLLIMDGGFGTTVLTKALTDKDFFLTGYDKKGCNDVLVLNRPDVVEEIHRDFLLAGADLISTNTFNANAISMADYGMEDLCYQLNLEGARLAKKAADACSDRKRFVAGSVGPTNKSASFPSDFMNPAQRAVSFEQLREAYQEQIEGLMDGGCDTILIETVFDSLNAKSALFACHLAFEKKGKALPVLISASVNEGGRLLSGQTLEAFYYSILSPYVVSVGLNCSFGVEGMIPFVRELAKYSDRFVSLYPNAGMPDEDGNYNSTPEQMAKAMKSLAEEGLLNMAGGCCGTTHHHIHAIARALSGIQPRELPAENEKNIFCATLAKELSADAVIGESMDITKNEGLLQAILSGDFDEVLDNASEDVENEADLLSIYLDHPDLDREKVIQCLMRNIAARPDISVLPVMLSSTSFSVLLSGLKAAQGRHIVRYHSLNMEQLSILKAFGCGIAVGSKEESAYEFLIKEAKIPKKDIIKLEAL